MPPTSVLASRSETIARLYKRMAATYDVVFGGILQNGRVKLAQALALQPGQRVVELGIGSGLMLPLYPRDAAVVGVDLSQEMLDIARTRAKELQMPHVELRLANAETTGLPSEQADHVLLTYIYTVTPNPAGLLAEAFRLCKPGGQVWIVGYFSDQGPWRVLSPLVMPVAKVVGFQWQFPYARHVTPHLATLNAKVLGVEPANPLGMSRLVRLQKIG
jgi:phosphatidylethanolamine/phosphatidyl-N-methylethanolamine N-methyltransferase